MTDSSENYLQRLEKHYREYADNDSLLLLADIRKMDQRVRELAVFREQPITQELIVSALQRFKNCVDKLTNPELNKRMTDEDRAYCFATMDWARFTLDMVGESPALLEGEIDKVVQGYVRKAGLST